MTTTISPALIAHDCPDCLSDTAIVHLADGVHLIEISHDPTCPTLAKIEATT